MITLNIRNYLPVLLVLLAGMFLSPKAAMAAPSQEDMIRQTKFEDLLADLKKTPTCEDWKGLGGNTLDMLAQRAASEQAGANLRMRAIFALGCFKENKAGEVLKALVDDPKTSALLRRPALKSYAESQGAKALPAIKKALTSREPMERIAAVESAGVIKDPAAKALLKKHMETEDLALVKDQIRKVLEAK